MSPQQQQQQQEQQQQDSPSSAPQHYEPQPQRQLAGSTSGIPRSASNASATSRNSNTTSNTNNSNSNIANSNPLKRISSSFSKGRISLRRNRSNTSATSSTTGGGGVGENESHTETGSTNKSNTSFGRRRRQSGSLQKRFSSNANNDSSNNSGTFFWPDDSIGRGTTLTSINHQSQSQVQAQAQQVDVMDAHADQLLLHSTSLPADRVRGKHYYNHNHNHNKKKKRHKNNTTNNTMNPPWNAEMTMLQSQLLEWVDSGIEFFGCDGDWSATHQNVIGHALLLPGSTASTPLAKFTSTNSLDGTQTNDDDDEDDEKDTQELAALQATYTKLHKDFFEAMLQEQLHFAVNTSPSPSTSTSTTTNANANVNINDEASAVLSNSSTTNNSIQAQAPNSTASQASSSIYSSPPAIEASASQDDSCNSAISSVSSKTFGSASTSSTRTRFRSKRHSALKLVRSASSNLRPRRIAPIDMYDQRYNPAHNNSNSNTAMTTPTSIQEHEQSNNDDDDEADEDAVVVGGGKPPLLRTESSLSSTLPTDFKPPSTYLHPDCILQKDKGKGDALGTSISAKGRSKCLDKLREKMAIVVQVSEKNTASGNSTGKKKKKHKRSNSSTTATTGMKRRPPKVSSVTPTYIETRSMIELRLGFLSMQYGLLLHWQTAPDAADNDDPKIVFMVLRKMCHDSFYAKIKPLIPEKKKHKNVIKSLSAANTHSATDPANSMMVDPNQSTALTTTTLGGRLKPPLEPPFLVPQPTSGFRSPSLTVTILKATGLSPDSRWTLSLTFEGHTETAALTYDDTTSEFKVERAPVQWDLDLLGPSSGNIGDGSANTLEIRLFEQTIKTSTSALTQKKKTKKKSKLASTLRMPLGNVVGHDRPAAEAQTLWQLSLPFSHNPQATNLQLSLLHVSHYAYWLHQEVEARKRAALEETIDDDDEEEEEEALEDWMCGMCLEAIC